MVKSGERKDDAEWQREFHLEDEEDP